MTCTTGEYCLVSEGGVVILDGGGPTYKCTKYPVTCTNGVSCQCLSAGQAACKCTESSAGYTVTCMFP
jgi:hypothetical protein